MHFPRVFVNERSKEEGKSPCIFVFLLFPVYSFLFPFLSLFTIIPTPTNEKFFRLSLSLSRSCRRHTTTRSLETHHCSLVNTFFSNSFYYFSFFFVLLLFLTCVSRTYITHTRTRTHAYIHSSLPSLAQSCDRFNVGVFWLNKSKKERRRKEKKEKMGEKKIRTSNLATFIGTFHFLTKARVLLV